MIVARSLQEINHQANSVVTVGTFDGIHVGHRTIINELITRARKRDGRSVVVTFDPHPREVVGRGPVKLLSSLDERLDMFKQLGVDAALVLQFTYEFSRQTSFEFYERYVVNGVGVKEVIVGYDHMFGRDREAGVKELQQMGAQIGFSAIAVPPVSMNGEVISSSRIREYLMRGDVEKTEQLLSRPYSLEGTVVQGDKRGASLGFPTANIRPLFENKLVPAEGVYFVQVDLNNQQLFGMLNIGVRPTFHNELKRVIEVNIFDFNEVIYGNVLRIHFVKRLRAEKKFSSKEELIAQLTRDRNECIKFMTTVQPS
jgi:riboflavin kinase/FMN adenylyltransferase